MNHEIFKIYYLKYIFIEKITYFDVSKVKITIGDRSDCVEIFFYKVHSDKNAFRKC